MAWGSLPQARGSGCQRFDSGWCFISASWRKENRRKGGKKKITMGKEGFPGAGLTLLAVQQVATVRCN
jgi:hypothetical protein